MFFVSEEFLRKYAEGEDVVQTIDAAVPPGQGLFDQEYQSKADFREQSHSQNVGSPPAPEATEPSESSEAQDARTEG